MTTHSTIPGYFTCYANFAFERTDDGVLTLRFHTNGGPITFTGQTHEDLPQALEEIALDQNNRALLLTGTGDTFMASIDGASLGEIYRLCCKNGDTLINSTLFREHQRSSFHEPSQSVQMASF